jgi:hypothetical protein
MNKIVNILEVDSKIRRFYEQEQAKRGYYENLLTKIESFLERKSKLCLPTSLVTALSEDRRLLKDKIRAIGDFEFYYFDTNAIISEFETIIRTPAANSFFSNGANNDILDDRKKDLVARFFTLVKNYCLENLDFIAPAAILPSVHRCDQKYIIVDECTSTCIACCQEKSRLVNNSSFVDNGRVNISSKYTYDRKIHFRDCINQYQGKQNTHIPKEVFKNLETALVNHRVIPSERTVDRFDRVTVSHIHMFLKNLNYTKYYDDAILIHSVITGTQPDNIEHLEDDLMKDFDAMLTEYDKNFKTADRKNFINTQYVLYQLLKRHKHKCDKDHFVVMRTMSDRKSYHDRVCKTIFAKFGWEFAP